MVPGAEVPPHYDSLIAKIIAHGPDRAACLDRLLGALRELRVEGITVNADLHRLVLSDPAFRQGGVTIHYLEKRLEAEREIAA